PYIAAYYRLWEKFWTERVPAGEWFARDKERQYLYFGWPKYLDQVRFDDIEKSRNFLEIALESVQTEQERKRARFLLKTFTYYEASALSYIGLKKGTRQEGKNIGYYQMMNKRRYDLVESFDSDPVLKHPLRFDKNSQLRQNFTW
ncbi:MAG: hypothetical protein D3925_16075, partial [Candidatus Electrothrix sp. AR5]|nr:hypothetical protein [Candidatus Electrothrix sp. AR5]